MTQNEISLQRTKEFGIISLLNTTPCITLISFYKIRYKHEWDEIKNIHALYEIQNSFILPWVSLCSIQFKQYSIEFFFFSLIAVVFLQFFPFFLRQKKSLSKRFWSFSKAQVQRIFLSGGIEQVLWTSHIVSVRSIFRYQPRTDARALNCSLISMPALPETSSWPPCHAAPLTRCQQTATFHAEGIKCLVE